MKKAKVTFEYKAQEDDELSLAIGDIITEVENADTGWCKGLLNGKRGMFPDNFVIFEEEDKKAPAPPSANKKPSKKKNVKRMKVLFPYAAENSDEISLEAGDVIEILKDVEDGWAEGINRGKRGVFPTNFGEIIEASSESEESGDGGLENKTEEPEIKSEEQSTASQKKVKGIGFGNIFGEGPIKLRQRSIGEADRKKNLSTSAASKPAAAKEKETVKEVQSKPKKVSDYCKVTFDYAKENEDELGLTKGEVVLIVNKNSGDDGWWEGEKTDENGKKTRGLFPDNFVSMLTPDEAREHEKRVQNKSEPDTSKEVKSSVKTPNKEVKKATHPMPVPPSQGLKPISTNDIGVLEDSTEIAFDEPKTAEHTLNHVKRPGGPKNRRKPDAAGRREKAAASEIQEEIPTVESEEEEKVVKTSDPAVKKDSTKRGVGVAVLPGLGPGGETATGETPSWLQNLKIRQSVKRPPPQTPAAKEQSPEAATTPSWLANLKKRQSSEFPNATARTKSPERVTPPKEKVTLQPKVADKPKPVADKAKPAEKALNGHAAILPPSKPAAPKTAAAKPTPKPAPPPSPTERPLAAWQIERQQKTKKVKEPNEDKAPEPPAASSASGEPAWKNASLPRKSPTVAKSPTEPQSLVTTPFPSAAKPDKPPVVAPAPTPLRGARAKPPPPKGKPAPAAKPASSTAVEELKTELKNMKEEMEKIRDEMKKEILRLNSELQNERNHRISLQDEVRKLQQQSAS